MTYDVLVEKEQERTYTATLLGGPRLSASAATREEALGRLRQRLERRLAKAEVVTIEVDVPHQPNPWVRLAGVYKNNPLFEEFLAEMEADRGELADDEAATEEAQ